MVNKGTVQWLRVCLGIILIGKIEAATNADDEHVKDSEVMLVFIALLVLTIITTFAFRFRSLRFLHESGLAIVYGLIIGAIRRYGTAGNPDDAKFGKRFYCSSTNDTVDQPFPVEHEGEKYVCGSPKVNLLPDPMLFDPEVFFNYLLPPIIFYAGYSLKKRHFFRNIGSILAFAFIGTTISMFAIGGITYGFVKITETSGLNVYTMEFIDCLMFGALVSATDPVTVLAVFKELRVDVNLDALMFGESVLNDAVAIVLVRSIDHYKTKVTNHGVIVTGHEANNGTFAVSNSTITTSNQVFSADAFFASLGLFIGVFLGSFAIGCCVSCINALFTKFTKIGQFPVMETAIFFLLSWSAFLIAEAVQFTGIVAVLFCGITQAHYTYNNLSEESKLRTKQLFEFLNFLAENFIFGYMGVAMFVFQHHKWMPLFIVGAFIALVVSRACNIYPLSFLLNLGRKRKISGKIQHMMMFSGLRGAIAFALAIKQTDSESQQVIFTTTLLIVFATVWILGGSTTQVLTSLSIKVGVDPDMVEDNVSTGETPRSESEPVSQLPRNTSFFRKYKDSAWMFKHWYKFDKYYLKPLLTHSGPPLTSTLPEVCRPCANCFTSQFTYMSQRNAPDSDTEFILNEDPLTTDDGLMPSSPVESTSDLTNTKTTVNNTEVTVVGLHAGSTSSSSQSSNPVFTNGNNNHNMESSQQQGTSQLTTATLMTVDVHENQYTGTDTYPMDQIPL